MPEPTESAASSPTTWKAPTPTRPTFTRRATSSFNGRLPELPPEIPKPPAPAMMTIDGKPIKIRYADPISNIDTSTLIPTLESLDVVATLFYTPPQTMNGVQRQDNHYGSRVSDMALFTFLQTLAALTIPWPKRQPLSAHRLLDRKLHVAEVLIEKPKNLSLSDLRRHEAIKEYEVSWGINVIFQHNSVFRRHRRLAVFDMDSTLIQQEVIDELADFIGKKAEVSAITERAMNGELDFTASLKERVALLKGVKSDVFEQLKTGTREDGTPRITFTPGARYLCKALKQLGFKLAVLSGGFVPLAQWVKDELGLDYMHANTLAVTKKRKEFVFSGEVTSDIVNAERKAELLEAIAKENDIPLEQVIAIGDGANDLKMMEKAGLGIAFNAKPHVQDAAPARINCSSLTDILYILGFTEEEQFQLIPELKEEREKERLEERRLEEEREAEMDAADGVGPLGEHI